MPASRLMTNARAVRNMTASNQHAELPGAREKTQRYDERRRTRRWVSYPEQYHHAAREPQPEGCGGDPGQVRPAPRAGPAPVSPQSARLAHPIAASTVEGCR